MTSPIATETVELVVDASSFERNLVRQLRTASRNAAKAFDQGLTQAMGATGRNAARELGDGISTGLRNDSRGQRAANNAGQQAGDEFSSGFRRALDFKAATTAIQTGLAPAKGLLAGLQFGVVAVQAAAAAQAIAQVGAALAPAVGIIAVLPAAVTTGAAAMVALKVALAGVGDAFGAALSGDAEAFEEALAKLSPAAQSVARELRELAPGFREVQQAVQDTFFGPLQGQLTAIAGVLQGPLQAGMVAVASAFGTGAAAVGGFLQEAQTVEFINQLFASTAVVITNIGASLGPVLSGFRDLSAVGLPFVERFSAGLRDIANDFGTFLSQSSESGRATAWIQSAVTVLGQLGFVFQQLGGIVQAVFRAMGDSGSEALGSIGALLLQVNQFFSSAEGQTALVAIFQTLSTVGTQLGGVFTTLVSTLGTLAPTIAQIAVAIGPGLQAAVEGIGGILQGLAPGIASVAESLSAAFTDTDLTGVLGQIAAEFGTMLTAVAPLLTDVAQLAAVFGTALLPTLQALQPVIRVLANVLGAISKVIKANQPLVTVLVTAFIAWKVAAIALAVAQGVLNAVMLANPIVLIVAAIVALIAVLVFAYQNSETFRNAVDALWQGIKTAFTFITNAVIAVGKAIVDGFVAVVNFFRDLPGKILDFLQAIPEKVREIFSNLASFAYEALVTGVAAIITFLFQLPGMIITAINTLPGMIAEFFVNLWNSALELTTTGIDAVVSFVTELPGKIFDVLSALPGALATFFTDMWNGAYNAVTAGVQTVIDFITGVPGKIGELAGAFLDVGKELIQNFIEGIQNFGSTVKDFGTAIVDFIKDKINAGIDKINGFIRDVNDKIPGGSFDIPLIDHFANGGIVNNETLAIIGEAGKEVVIPMTRPKRALELAEKSGLIDLLARQSGATVGGSVSHGGNTIHVHTQVTDPELIARRIVGQLAFVAGI